MGSFPTGFDATPMREGGKRGCDCVATTIATKATATTVTATIATTLLPPRQQRLDSISSRNTEAAAHPSNFLLSPARPVVGCLTHARKCTLTQCTMRKPLSRKEREEREGGEREERKERERRVRSEEREKREERGERGEGRVRREIEPTNLPPLIARRGRSEMKWLSSLNTKHAATNY